MPELVIPTSTARASELCGSQPENIEQFLACNSHVGDQQQWLPPHLAYDVSGLPSPLSDGVTRQINQLPAYQRSNLSSCVDTFGEETSLLARFYERHIEPIDMTAVSQNANGVGGVGTAVLSGRTDSFQMALEHYQRTLIDLNNANGIGRVAAQTRIELRDKVKQAYDTLNRYYQQELRRLVPASSFTKNKGTALSNADRGITLAERSRGRGIHVADMYEGQQVGKLAKGLRYAGRGAIVLDIGFRANAVQNSYANGENWKREMAVQTGGFTASTLAGAAVGRAAFLTLGRIALMATPWGWGILIASTVITGAVLAYQMDQASQHRIGNAWDRWIR
ncbi:hypothetical protein NBRC116494_21460 [Aurantivibrio plasticivorans]